MKNLLCLFILFFTLQLVAQENVIYSFTNISNTDAITHIYINNSITQMNEIPDQIGKMENLKELVIFSENRRLNDRLSESELMKIRDKDAQLVNHLPESISNLKMLETLKIPTGDIKSLPEGFEELNSLRILQLPSGTDLNTMHDQLIQLKSLEQLICTLCEQSDENRMEFISHHPDIKTIITEDELLIAPKTYSLYGVTIDEKYQIMFDRPEEAVAYLECIPKEIRNRLKLRLAE